METLEQRIHALAKDLQLLHVATVDADGRPRVRPVVGKANEKLELRFSTHLDSTKVRHLQHNPEVHITLADNDIRSRRWLQIEGRASISTSETERRAFWFDGMQAYISGIDDPRYCVVIVQPSRIELCSLDKPQAEVWLAGKANSA